MRLQPHDDFRQVREIPKANAGGSFFETKSGSIALASSCYSCRLTKLPSLSSAGSSCAAINAGSAVFLIDRCRQTA